MSAMFSTCLQTTGNLLNRDPDIIEKDQKPPKMICARQNIKRSWNLTSECSNFGFTTGTLTERGLGLPSTWPAAMPAYLYWWFLQHIVVTNTLNSTTKLALQPPWSGGTIALLVFSLYLTCKRFHYGHGLGRSLYLSAYVAAIVKLEYPGTYMHPQIRRITKLVTFRLRRIITLIHPMACKL